MLLGILLYCFKRDIRNLSDIVVECKTNRILRVFTRKYEPSLSTFKRFLENSSPEIMRKVFLYTLVVLNDYEFLKFIKAFIDGTDALVRGSRYYTINKDVIESMKWMKHCGLLHNNRKNSMERTRKKLNEMRGYNNGNKEFNEMLDLILNNLKIYNKNVYKKIPEFEAIMKERDINYVSITFPSAVMMKTKKGRFDFAFNLQEIITENDVVITGLLVNQPNDFKVLPLVMKELEVNFKILVELQQKYGKRRNYKELERMLENARYICDSGYFTDDNLEFMDKHGYKCIIMTKNRAKQINNEIRKEKNIPTKKKKNPIFNHVTQVKDGFICRRGFLIELSEFIPVNKQKNKRKGVKESWKEHRYIYRCEHCTTCPHSNLCNFEKVTITTTPLKHDMDNKLCIKEINDDYNERFHHSEFINGNLKGNDGTLLLPGHDKTAVNNVTNILNTLHNIFRHKNLKGTAY